MFSMSDRKVINIEAVWHEDEKVWVATSPDLPGLVTDAHDFESLRRRLSLLVPDFVKSLAQQDMTHVPPEHIVFDVNQSAPY